MQNVELAQQNLMEEKARYTSAQFFNLFSTSLLYASSNMVVHIIPVLSEYSILIGWQACIKTV